VIYFFSRIGLNLNQNSFVRLKSAIFIVISLFQLLAFTFLVWTLEGVLHCLLVFNMFSYF